ncbi:hypothetical protein T484DRAFT_1900515 [Baffinella frigidus]|nr:hypothetical protein T484DRAFT_1900515 [Cryptophyta sp. CCMP2293]
MTERQLKQKENSLCCWLERRPTPYPTLEDQTAIAEELSLSLAQVANFCHRDLMTAAIVDGRKAGTFLTRAKTRDLETGGVSVVPDGIPGDMSPSQFGRVFNVRVTSMEYLNDQNIAVQVLRSSVTSYDPNIYEFSDTMFRGQNGGHMVSYRTYFLNPETMRLRMDMMWEEDNAASELGQGLLCPSQRRMPDVGSMTAEVVASWDKPGIFEMIMGFVIPEKFDPAFEGTDTIYG